METEKPIVKRKCSECHYHIVTTDRDELCVIQPVAIPRPPHWPACARLWVVHKD